jgi:hypothetical protein
MKNSLNSFKYFNKLENEIKLFIYPFSFNIGKAADNLQLELTDLQSDNGLGDNLNSVKCADYFGLLCDEEQSNFKDFGEIMLSIFASMKAGTLLCVV